MQFISIHAGPSCSKDVIRPGVFKCCVKHQLDSDLSSGERQPSFDHLGPVELYSSTF